MSVMVHAGYLTEKENYVEGGAAELFFLHRDKIIEERKVNQPVYEGIPRGDEIRNKSFYPTFHDNWISGILRTSLAILNVKPGIRNNYKKLFSTIPSAPPPLPGPIHDPWYVYEKIFSQPDLTKITIVQEPLQLNDANSIKNYFIAPALQGELQLIADLKVPPDTSPPNIPETNFKLRLAQLVEANPVEILEIVPDVPSEAFPDLNYGEGLSLADKQKNLATSIVNSFKDLSVEIENDPDLYLVPIGLTPLESQGVDEPGPGLAKIFTKAKEILDKNFGTYAEVEEPDIAVTNILNYEALKRTLVKPLYLAVIGSVFGSHPKGFVAAMAIVAPDDVGTLNANDKFKTDPVPVVLDYLERVSQQQSKGKKKKIPSTDPPQETPLIKTPSTGADVVVSLTKAWVSLFDTTPAFHSIQIIFAQCVTENGYDTKEGKFMAMHNYNIGNVKYVANPKPPANNLGQLWHRRSGVFEYLDPKDPTKKTILDKNNPGAWFRSFETLDEGCEFHLEKLKNKFSGAWQYVMTGDASGFAQALKNAKYYTATVAEYTSGVKNGMHVCINTGGEDAYNAAIGSLV